MPTTTTDRHSARVRRADDAVLTEIARSLLREGRPAEDAFAGRPTLAQAGCDRHASPRFRRAPRATRLRTGAAPVA